MEKNTDVIKYEGDNNTLIWKHPLEDFNSRTQLIVCESQQAVFFMNGGTFEVFGPGCHTLDTKYDQTQFHGEVYFINTTVQMTVKWGAGDQKVRYVDPKYGVPLPIGACGEINLKVIDGLKFITKLNDFAWGKKRALVFNSPQRFFKGPVLNAVNRNLSASINEIPIHILEVNEHLDELSAVLKSKLLQAFEAICGLTIQDFYLTTVDLSENDPNFKKIKRLYTASL